ncbi:hypothetical protein EJ05DRAFT_183272 [Pseudovirgaria hyperparasitica]|uniref:SET domain-containing protein n=1 Tax=Pseudovirgaria hyperparasitica TaxID=470096 RepID=A0A6A6WHM1_9PEZI|nr:uncharacterized protein EJ05DRAFT_183272 [Pseudovirgaria hyperparasitica]KAF2761729.1 hypothetical protein EJ05DRAFT_183272 [Pseudovirgaria hyperparasitica]
MRASQSKDSEGHSRPDGHQLYDRPMSQGAHDNDTSTSDNIDVTARAREEATCHRDGICEGKKAAEEYHTALRYTSGQASTTSDAGPSNIFESIIEHGPNILEDDKGGVESEHETIDAETFTRSNTFTPRYGEQPLDSIQSNTRKRTRQSPHVGRYYHRKPLEQDAHIDSYFSTFPGMTSPGSVSADVALVRNIPRMQGAGAGMMAVKCIATGTRIMTEAPVFTYGIPPTGLTKSNQSIWIDRFEHELTSEWKLFSHLYNAFPNMGRKYGTFHTNSLPLGTKSDDPWGMFPAFARLNHSCQANAFQYWNTERQVYTLHAVRDIDAGEEITISYDNALKIRQDRRRRLWGAARFQCTCPKCDTHPDEFSLSDEQIISINTIFETVMRHLDGLPSPPSGEMSKYYTSAECLRLLFIAHEIIAKEGLDGLPLLKASELSMLVARKSKDPARTRKFAERQATIWLILTGDDSSDFKLYKSIAKNPRKHFKFGLRGFFKSSRPPPNIKSSQSDRWLFRKLG